MAGESSLDERYASLRRRFAARAVEQAARIVELRQLIAAGRGGPESVQEMQRLAHSLHGSAGTFGYAPIGCAAGIVEELCAMMIRVFEADAPPPDEFDQAVAKLLGLIERIETSP